MIGHSKLFANISSYGDYPFPEQFSVFRELMERYFNAILVVKFLTPGNTTVLRHISDYATTCKHVNIESWPSMPRSRATRPRSSKAAAILEKGVYYLKYINRAILANLQLGNSLISSPHPLFFDMLVIFSSKNAEQGHKLELTYLYACWIIHRRHHLQISK